MYRNSHIIEKIANFRTKNLSPPSIPVQYRLVGTSEAVDWAHPCIERVMKRTLSKTEKIHNVIWLVTFKKNR